LKKLLAVPIVVLAFLPVLLLLVARVWVQVTSQSMNAEDMDRLFSVTDSLAGPFEALTGSPPLRTTGVVDYTVLVAIEGYFVAMLVAVCLVIWSELVWAFLTRRRKRELPAFVRAMKAPRSRRRAWQPMAPARRRGRFYVARRMEDELPVHQKAGLGPV
jgi:hypothetical protein